MENQKNTLPQGEGEKTLTLEIENLERTIRWHKNKISILRFHYNKLKRLQKRLKAKREI